MPRTIPPAPCPTPTAAPAPASNCSDGEPCRVEAAAATDLNIMVLVAAIICAFVCALGLNSMLQCVVRCASRTLIEPIEWANSRRLNSGLKRKEMVALPISIYAAGLGSPSPSSGCAICLMDYSEGEKIRVLPKCNHRFHVACIDKWLLCHSSCPTCRNRVNSNDNTTCSSL